MNIIEVTVLNIPRYTVFCKTVEDFKFDIKLGTTPKTLLPYRHNSRDLDKNWKGMIKC